MTTGDGKIFSMEQSGNFSYTLTDESVIFSINEFDGGKISYLVNSCDDKSINLYV